MPASAARWSCSPSTRARSSASGAALNAGGDAGGRRRGVRAGHRRHRRAAARRPESEATLAEALHLPCADGRQKSLQALTHLLDRADLPFTGWTIPIEPLLADVRRSSAYSQIATRLADRAR